MVMRPLFRHDNLDSESERFLNAPPSSSDLEDEDGIGESQAEQATLDNERIMENEMKAFDLLKRRNRHLLDVLNYLCIEARQLDYSHRIIRATTSLANSQDRAFGLFERITKRSLGSSRGTNAQNTRVQRQAAGRRDMKARRSIPDGENVSMHGTGRSSSNLQEEKFDIYKNFQDWATDTGRFVGIIRKLHGHSIMDVVMRMGSFETDLKYWASCLKVYEDAQSGDIPAIQKYVCCLGIEAGEHMKNSSEALLQFIKDDMPNILQSQQPTSNRFLTVSTLFCGVTATVIQFSYTQHTLPYTIANVAWIFSLGLSTAATIFSILKATLKGIVFSRWHRLSVLALLIVEGAPLCFLAASIVSFFLGLCAFAHAIDQGAAIVLLTALVASMCALGVIVDLLGFIPIRGPPEKSRDIEMGQIKDELLGELEGYKFVPVLRYEDIRQNRADPEAILAHEALVQQARLNRTHRNEFAKTSEILASLCAETRTLHVITVSHMEFSPDGRFLATCSQDRTCLILDVDNLLAEKRVFGIRKGHVRQITWSSRNHILTRLQYNIILWDPQTSSDDPQPSDMNSWKMTINRRSEIQQVLWFPNQEKFLSVESHMVIEFDINGNEGNTHDLGCGSAHDDVDSFVYSIAISSDEKYLICIVKLNKSPDKLSPNEDTRKEKQIIVYNMSIKRIECRVPIFHEVRHVSMSKDDFALIGYEGTHPPQLWHLIRPSNENTRAHLVLSRTYLLKPGDDISIPPCFGGTNEQLVICARKSGDIHVWDRSSAFLYRYIESPASKSNNDRPEVLSLAGNTRRLMFATGQHDGSIKVWSRAGTPGSQEEPEASQSTGQPSAGPSRMS